MTLRRMTEDDLEMVLEWRNAPSVREKMYTSHLIKWNEHKQWFQGIRNDSSCLWLIYEDPTPQGVVYFTNIDMKCKKAFWGFYAGDTKQVGIGICIAYEAMCFAFDHMQLRKLNCEVLEFNRVVINQHYKFGFKKEGIFRKEHCKNGEYIDVIRMGIFSQEWREVEASISKKVERIKKKQKRNQK